MKNKTKLDLISDLCDGYLIIQRTKKQREKPRLEAAEFLQKAGVCVLTEETHNNLRYVRIQPNAVFDALWDSLILKTENFYSTKSEWRLSQILTLIGKRYEQQKLIPLRGQI